MRIQAWVIAVALAGCSAAEPSHPPRAYVSNESDGTVSVVDLHRREVIATIPVGKRPRGLRLSPDGRTLYVALSGSPKAPPGVDEATLPPPDRSADGIGVVDLEADKVVRVLASGQDPESFDLRGDVLVVSNEETAEAAIVDVATGTIRARVPVGGEPEGVTTAPDHTVWVTCEAAGEVDVIDPDRAEVIARIAVGARPRQIAFTPDGRRAFVSNENDATVSVIDVASRTVSDTIALGAGARPMGVVVSRDGRRLFVSTGRGKTVVAIDARTLAIENVAAGAGARPWGLAAGADTLVYAAGGPSDDLVIVDPSLGTVIATVDVGASPWGVAIDR